MNKKEAEALVQRYATLVVNRVYNGGGPASEQLVSTYNQLVNQLTQEGAYKNESV